MRREREWQPRVMFESKVSGSQKETSTRTCEMQVGRLEERTAQRVAVRSKWGSLPKRSFQLSGGDVATISAERLV